MDEMTEDILQSLPARSLRAGIFSIPARRRQKGRGLAALAAHFAQFICTQKSRVKAEKTKIFFQKASSGFGDVSFKERSGRFKA
jgi:hypothetical protein